MKPDQPLPIDKSWSGTDAYVDSLLDFVATSAQFQNLCGGVHVLDFLTRDPGLYDTVLPQEWRTWFENVIIEDVLHLLLREDLQTFTQYDQDKLWRGHPYPPASLVEYIQTIRRHSLARNICTEAETGPLPRHIAVGMKPKKIHEVTKFAAFVNDLSSMIETTNNSDQDDTDISLHSWSQEGTKTTIIDFGSGQNYLGRTLACSPYYKSVIAIEQRHHNVEGAKDMDIHAKLAKKEKNMINKKDWKKRWLEKKEGRNSSVASSRDVSSERQDVPNIDWHDIEDRIPFRTPKQREAATIMQSVQADLQVDQLIASTNTVSIEPNPDATLIPATPDYSEDHGSSTNSRGNTPIPSSRIRYIEKELSDGNLNSVISSDATPSMVVSIHSCGNLTHHGLRSLTLNPSVKAVAMIGCCYNLLTERLGPPTYKLPTLRSNHPRLEETGNAYDEHGFPMSQRLERHQYNIGINGKQHTIQGIRLNITARMMGVQAPHNWGPKDSEDFFTRHYYRALLQRMLLDLGVVKMSSPDSASGIDYAGGSHSGKDSSGAPLIIGSLRKACFKSFPAYVRGAVEKLGQDPVDGPETLEKTRSLFENDESLIHDYEVKYTYAKKQLSVIWSLMAFSANLVESTILVDRWLWLKEQKGVDDAWVEAVFDYKQSPRNMVVVGIKKAVV